MKRKYLAYERWGPITKSARILRCGIPPDYPGYATALFIQEVSSPMEYTYGGHTVRAADAGYTWIQRLSLGEHHAITAMWDDQGHILFWYIDITAQNALDEKGDPFYDDLYLDIVLMPCGETYLLDEDELLDALLAGQITQAQYDLAYNQAQRLLSDITSALPELFKASEQDYLLDFLRNPVYVARTGLFPPVVVALRLT